MNSALLKLLLCFMMSGRVNPDGAFGGCVPKSKIREDAQKVKFDIPVPYGIAYSTFAYRHEPELGKAKHPLPLPINYSLSCRWRSDIDYSLPAILCEKDDNWEELEKMLRRGCRLKVEH